MPFSFVIEERGKRCSQFAHTRIMSTFDQTLSAARASFSARFLLRGVTPRRKHSERAKAIAMEEAYGPVTIRDGDKVRRSQPSRRSIERRWRSPPRAMECRA